MASLSAARAGWWRETAVSQHLHAVWYNEERGYRLTRHVKIRHWHVRWSLRSERDNATLHANNLHELLAGWTERKLTGEWQ